MTCMPCSASHCMLGLTTTVPSHPHTNTLQVAAKAKNQSPFPPPKPVMAPLVLLLPRLIPSGSSISEDRNGRKEALVVEQGNWRVWQT